MPYLDKTLKIGNNMKIFALALLSLSAVNALSFADLVDHLKKAEGKTDRYKMRNIDFIYMINFRQKTGKICQGLAKR